MSGTSNLRCSQASSNNHQALKRGGDGVEYIAWEGFVSPSKELLTVGGFRATGLWIKVSLVISFMRYPSLIILRLSGFYYVDDGTARS